jgi:UDP-N-acetylglucosamine 2-epimerase (hydrolysing)
MKKIVFLTGTRADFGKLKPLINKVENEDSFEPYIFATGMHTISSYGYTINEIKKCGFKNIFPYINQTEYNGSDMDIVLSKTIMGFGYYIRELKPDMIVVHGDRVEALAGAIVGSLNNILVSHIEGGELSGTIDELIRHSISKLAHIHFVSNKEAKNRLLQMGELPTSIFIIGSPDIDVMLSDDLPHLDDVKIHYDIEFDDYGIFCYHPVTTQLEDLHRNIKEVVDALIESKRNFIVIHPNNDAGSDIIFNELSRLNNNSYFKIFPSLRFESFLTLLKNSRVIVGNSSAGIREAPVYGVPTVNIGKRQENRFNSHSIFNVDEKKDFILNSLENIPSHCSPSLYFGEGRSAELFLEYLNEQKIWKIPCQKQFQDIN